MLFDESDVFTQEEGDISSIPNLQLKVNVCMYVMDQTPIQKCYNSISKPLFKEVKDYVQNPLDKA